MSNPEVYRKRNFNEPNEARPDVLVPAYKLIINLQKENARLNRMCGEMKAGINAAKSRMHLLDDLERKVRRLEVENDQLIDRINEQELRHARRVDAQ